MRQTTTLLLAVFSVLCLSSFLIVDTDFKAWFVKPCQVIPSTNPTFPVYPVNVSICKLDSLRERISEILFKYYKRLADNNAHRKIVIFEVTDGAGGLGDRLRGVAFSFILALLTNSHFLLRHENGGLWGMDTVFRPRERVASVVNISASLDGRVFYSLVDNYDKDYYKTHNFSEDFEASLSKIVKIRTNTVCWIQLLENPCFHEAVGYYRLRELTNLDLFRLAIDAVWSDPSEDLSTEMKKYPFVEKRSHMRRVGVQIRTGDHGFVGDGSVRITTLEAECFAQEVGKFCDDRTLQFVDPCVVFVTSDSPDAIKSFITTLNTTLLRPDSTGKMAGHIPRVHVSEGAISHVDRAPPKERIDVLKTYVDWFILSQMDLLFITRSGYGETPSWVNKGETYQLKTSGTSKVAKCLFQRYDNVIGFSGPFW
jgi:hypothetical protein